VDHDGSNPFAGYGTIVSGLRFLGRAEGLHRINARIVRSPRPGNLAIVGQPRIGKSSLAYQAIMHRRGDLLAQGKVPIWLNLGWYTQSARFFADLVRLTANELRTIGRIDGDLDELFVRVQVEAADGGESHHLINDFFSAVKGNGFYTIVVLDEFDYARSLFQGNPSAFHRLRDLNYYPTYGVAFLTTSRRTLGEIEIQCNVGSPLTNTMQNYSLGLFSDEDLETYFSRLSDAGIVPDSHSRGQLLKHTGRHPFLLDAFAFWLKDQMELCGPLDIEAAAGNASDDVLALFDHIVDLLREDERLSRLMQIVFGPNIDVQQTHIDEFLRSGLIIREPDGTVRPFSETFGDFLRMLDREIQDDVELGTMWRRTERELRRLIATTLHHVYGEHWLAHVEKNHRSVALIIGRCRDAQAREEKSFPGRASQNLLDFTYPGDLFDLIFAEWQRFHTILGRDKKYWNERGTLLSKIRNPLAHNRDEFLYEWERQTAEAYCHEILALIQDVRHGNPGPTNQDGDFQ
jgi:hypothetical protein